MVFRDLTLGPLTLCLQLHCNNSCPSVALIYSPLFIRDHSFSIFSFLLLFLLSPFLFLSLSLCSLLRLRDIYIVYSVTYKLSIYPIIRLRIELPLIYISYQLSNHCTLLRGFEISFRDSLAFVSSSWVLSYCSLVSPLVLV